MHEFSVIKKIEEEEMRKVGDSSLRLHGTAGVLVTL